MRLSEEKIERIAENLADMLESREDLIEIGGDRRQLERDLVRFIVADLKIEDEITQEALARMETYSREVPPGTTEWTVLLAKHKEEIAARRGYVL
jgi:hypothetical protein